MNNILLYTSLILMTILGAFGGYFFKKATEKIKDLKTLFFCKELYVGGILYFISALLNIFLLKYLSYSLILPLTAITYVWTLIISYRFLNEKINKNKKIGVFLIIVSAILISL